MSLAELWAEALQAPGQGFTLNFDRLGLAANCRPLTAGEVEECVRMGGQRGLRYALYLACDDLREAGETLKKQGAAISQLDLEIENDHYKIQLGNMNNSADDDIFTIWKKPIYLFYVISK